MKLVNEGLYNVLKARFGEVQVANPGMAAIREVSTDAITGRRRTVTEFGGEQFKVCCPFCSDRRFRLYISHLWGTKDPRTHRRMISLARCFNETHCMDTPGKYDELDIMLRAYASKSMRYRAKPVSPDEPLTIQPWPGAIVPINELEPSHKAVKYLRDDRGLDIDKLADRWGVSYCYHSERWRHAEDRIIIPIYMDTKLVGWQGRWIGEDYPKGKKYYSLPGMQRRKLIYNYDVARQFPYVVLAEGPSDVWNIGNPGACIFGSSASPAQKALLIGRWAKGTMLLLLDGDAWDDSERLRDELKARIETFLPIRLPDKRDPGDWDPIELWKFLIEMSEKAGIDLIGIDAEAKK